jgi:hypothetical protein
MTPLNLLAEGRTIALDNDVQIGLVYDVEEGSTRSVEPASIQRSTHLPPHSVLTSQYDGIRLICGLCRNAGPTSHALVRGPAPLQPSIDAHPTPGSERLDERVNRLERRMEREAYPNTTTDTPSAPVLSPISHQEPPLEFTTMQTMVWHEDLSMVDTSIRSVNQQTSHI